MSASESFSGLERRKFPRLPLQEDVTMLWAGRRIGGLSRDVSGGGIAFSIELGGDAWGRALLRGLSVGARLRLFFDMPDSNGGKRSANLLSNVVRIESGGGSLNTVEICAAF